MKNCSLIITNLFVAIAVSSAWGCDDRTIIAEVEFDRFSGDAGGDAPPTGTCGNGVVEGAETCDDGNNISGDGCDASCQSEPVRSSLHQR